MIVPDCFPRTSLLIALVMALLATRPAQAAHEFEAGSGWEDMGAIERRTHPPSGVAAFAARLPQGRAGFRGLASRRRDALLLGALRAAQLHELLVHRRRRQSARRHGRARGRGRVYLRRRPPRSPPRRSPAAGSPRWKPTSGASRSAATSRRTAPPIHASLTRERLPRDDSRRHPEDGRRAAVHVHHAVLPVRQLSIRDAVPAGADPRVEDADAEVRRRLLRRRLSADARVGIFRSGGSKTPAYGYSVVAGISAFLF